MSAHGSRSTTELSFSAREIRDLGAAWLALGVAFALFFFRPELSLPLPPGFGVAVGVSLLTVGVGFLFHELAHKVVAVRFDQVAEFRADYGMLLLAIAGGLAGFIFAAPGAVYHRGRLTEREQGLIALAGPVTNLGLAAVFAPVLFAFPDVGVRGVQINLLLAAFNMLPVASLDGRTVIGWSKAVYAAVAAVSVVLALWSFVGL